MKEEYLKILFHSTIQKTFIYDYNIKNLNMLKLFQNNFYKNLFQKALYIYIKEETIN